MVYFRQTISMRFHMSKPKSPSSNSSKASALFLTIFQILLLLAIGAIGGLSMNHLFNRTSTGNFIYLVIFAYLFVSYYLQIILHEGGHLVMGLLTGYRFLSFRIGNFVLVKRNGKISFGRFNLPGTGGQCLLLPPPVNEDGRYPTTLYNMGGVIFNLISSLIAALLALVLRPAPYIALFFVFFGLIGIYFAAINGIPFPNAMIPNDAVNARLIRRSPAAMRAFRLSQQLLGEIADGKHTYELPDEWFELPSPDEMQNSFTTTIAVMACERQVSKQDYTGAKDMIRSLLDAPIAMADYHRNLLKIHLIVCLLLTEHTEEEVNAILTKEQKNFIQMLSPTLEGVTCQYAISILWEKDPKKASAAEAQFAKIKERYPYPVEVEEAEVRLQAIRQKAVESSSIPNVSDWKEHQ